MEMVNSTGRNCSSSSLGDFRKLPAEIRELIWEELLETHGQVTVTLGTWEGKGAPIRDKDGRSSYPERWHYPTKQPEVRTQIPLQTDDRKLFGACIPGTHPHNDWPGFVHHRTQPGAKVQEDEGGCTKPALNAILRTSLAIYNEALNHFFGKNTFVFCACTENLQDMWIEKRRVAKCRFSAIDVLYAFLLDMDRSRGRIVGQNLHMIRNVEIHLSVVRGSKISHPGQSIQRWREALDLLKTKTELDHLTICMTGALPEIADYVKFARTKEPERNGGILDASILGELTRLRGRVKCLTVRHMGWEMDVNGTSCRNHGQHSRCRNRNCQTSGFLSTAAAAFKIINDSIQPNVKTQPAICKVVDGTRPSRISPGIPKRTRYIVVKMGPDPTLRDGFTPIENWIKKQELAKVEGLMSDPS